MKDIQTGVELNEEGRCVLGNTKPRFICEYSMRYRMAHGVLGCETVEDLERYLSTNPHPDYRLASCQHMQTGNWHLVWEALREG